MRRITMTGLLVAIAIACTVGSSSAEEVTPNVIMQTWQSRCESMKTLDSTWDTKRLVPKGAMSKTYQFSAMMIARQARGDEKKLTDEQIRAIVVPTQDTRLDFETRLRHDGKGTHFSTSAVTWVQEKGVLEPYPEVTHWHAGKATIDQPKGFLPKMPERVRRTESAEFPELLSIKIAVPTFEWMFGKPGFRGPNEWKSARMDKDELVLTYAPQHEFRLRVGSAKTGFRIEAITYRAVMQDDYRAVIRRDARGEMTGWQMTMFDEGNEVVLIDDVRIRPATLPQSVEVPTIVPGKDAIVHVISGNKLESRVADGSGNERPRTTAEQLSQTSDVATERRGWLWWFLGPFLVIALAFLARWRKTMRR